MDSSQFERIQNIFYDVSLLEIYNNILSFLILFEFCFTKKYIIKFIDKIYKHTYLSKILNY